MKKISGFLRHFLARTHPIWLQLEAPRRADTSFSREHASVPRKLFVDVGLNTVFGVAWMPKNKGSRSCGAQMSCGNAISALSNQSLNAERNP